MNGRDNRRLALPVGVSEFPEVAGGRYWYADKTLMIRDLIDEGAKAVLITRPRRFGKSLNVGMLRSFFEVPEPGDDTARLFRHRRIWACGEEYTAHQGVHPVISLSLKGARRDTWDQTRDALSRLVRSEALRVRRLVDEGRCDEAERESLRRIWSGKATEDDLAEALLTLTSALHKSCGRQAVVLIDEYDVPISRGHHLGFYREATDFMRVLLGEGMKDNPHLFRGVLTGVLRVAKEGMFSGFNNPEIYTVLDDRYSTYFGLTSAEVQELLGHFGASEKYDEVRTWYDGYVFGSTEVYNPWSVLKYVKSGCVPDAYWTNTSENSALREIVAKTDPDTLGRIRTLLEGGSVTSTIDVGTVYPRIADDATSIWSYLLMAGYLKASGRSFVARRWRFRLEVPNEEVRQAYEDEVLLAFHQAMPASATNPVAVALIDGNAEVLCDAFSRLLECASVRDLWGEAFYQGFVLALVALMDGFGYKVDSNRESGDGYFDIQLDPCGTGHPGIVVEIKALSGESSGSDALHHSAEAALAQVFDKDYARELRRRNVCTVLCYGVAFHGRDVAVAYGKYAPERHASRPALPSTIS